MIFNKEKDQQAKKKKKMQNSTKKDLEDKCFGTSQQINFLRNIAMSLHIF